MVEGKVGHEVHTFYYLQIKGAYSPGWYGENCLVPSTDEKRAQHTSCNHDYHITAS